MSILKEVTREFLVPVEVIESSNPNHLGCIALVKKSGADVWWFYDATYDDCEPWTNEYSSEERARKEYNSVYERLVRTLNWEAQAEYDEMHGTVNGRDPGVLAWEEAFGMED